MYLYEHVRERYPAIKIAWITGDRDLARQLRSSGRQAFPRASLGGVRVLLRAGVNVYASDPADTSFALTGGALNVNPYHGLPIKQIEFAIDTPAAQRVYHPRSLADRLRSHSIYAPKWCYQDIIATSSDWAEERFRRSYQERVGRVVLGCSPRMAAALEERALPAVLLDGERELRDRLAQDERAVILFVPTWRRYRWESTDVLGSPKLLGEVLERSRTTLLLKGHLYSANTMLAAAHTEALPNAFEVSSILPFVDAVITDYSSIGLDAALLGKPVIWAPVDRSRYVRNESPGFELDYDELIAGRSVSSPEVLHEVLMSQAWRGWTVPEPLVSKIWGTDARSEILRGNDRLVAAVTEATRPREPRAREQ